MPTGGTQNFQFGSGYLFIDNNGPSVAQFPTPLAFGTLQEVSLDVSGSIKELYGKNRMPVAVAATEVKITGKAKAAQFNVELFNAVFFGGTPATGQTNKMALFEANTPATGTFTVANGATFVQDYGVFDTITQLWMSRITTGTPTAGQYKVAAAGVYTVASADTNPKQVCYTYSVAASGLSFKIPNIPMGSNPTFGVALANNQWQGIDLTLLLYQCGSNKMTFGWKNADWMVPEFDFYAMDNGSGFVGEFNYDNAT